MIGCRRALAHFHPLVCRDPYYPGISFPCLTFLDSARDRWLVFFLPSVVAAARLPLDAKKITAKMAIGTILQAFKALTLSKLSLYAQRAQKVSVGTSSVRSVSAV